MTSARLKFPNSSNFPKPSSNYIGSDSNHFCYVCTVYKVFEEHNLCVLSLSLTICNHPRESARQNGSARTAEQRQRVATYALDTERHVAALKHAPTNACHVIYTRLAAAIKPWIEVSAGLATFAI